MTKRNNSKRKIFLQLGVNFWGKAPFLWKGAENVKWKASPGEHKKKHYTSERYAPVSVYNTVTNRHRLGYTTALPEHKVSLLYYEPKYASQLHEKQKLRGMYRNISERQLYRTYLKARGYRGKVGDTMLKFFERRLDTVLFRASFVNSFYHARQLVNHGHVLVNGRIQNIASACLRRGDVVSIKPTSIPLLCDQFNWSILKQSNGTLVHHIPYLEVDYKTMSAVFLYTPTTDEININFPLDMNKVTRYYI